MNNIYSFIPKSILFVSFIYLSSALAINDLSAKLPGEYVQKPAYIENVLLVCEPHGGYVEQSLYLQYSDHNAFPDAQNVEIVHRFEMPEGSVINDLWLWTGDNIMRAIMKDEWTARKIYDSVINVHKDPAFLTKNGNQYELHIFPLISGSFRKIKINFITPTKWLGLNAASELPLRFLKASYSSQVPLNVYFRTTRNIWGTPGINEIPDQVFTQFTDTAGYNYKRTFISDVKPLQSFNLTFTTDFADGTYFNNNIIPNEYNYFQFGIVPWKAFNLTRADSFPSNVITGIDLSGNYNKNYTVVLPNIKTSIKSALKQSDMFNIIVSGAGKVVPLNSSLIPYSSAMVDNLIDAFSTSTFGDSVAEFKKPVILYCDSYASTIWDFPSIADNTVRLYGSDIVSSIPSFSASNVVCSYKEGYENVISEGQGAAVIQSLDSLFLRGGRFLTYYDFNRVGNDRFAIHYAPNIKVKYRAAGSVHVSRNIDGNIGSYFPETAMSGPWFFFDIDSDTSIKAELVDDDGNPCVISKRLGNGGLIVITGIWAFIDDVPLREQLGTPQLGLNSFPNSENTNMLIPLLQYYADINNQPHIDKFLTFSNNDSLITSDGTNGWINNYLNKFTGKPVFNSINLLDGSAITPPSITINGYEYYGNGYLMQRLADNSKGMHFETHLTDWTDIEQKLLPPAHNYIDSIFLTPVLQSPSGSIKEIIEVNADRLDSERPLFFLASTNSLDGVDMNVDVKFAGDTTFRHSTFSYQFAGDTSSSNRIVSSMMGYEKLKNMFLYNSADTAGIVYLAIKYNLLCDYTGLIALEPNDTIHYIINPYDESSITKVEIDSTLIKSYSLAQNYPNPFNPATTIKFNLPKAGKVSLKVYDILGNEIRNLVDEYKGAGIYSMKFDGKGLASGIYIYRLSVDKFVFNRKMLLLK